MKIGSLLRGVTVGIVCSVSAANVTAKQNEELCRQDPPFTHPKGSALVAADPAEVQSFIDAATLGGQLPEGVVQEMIWADFDGDGYDELALVIAHYSTPSAPPDTTDIFLMDGPENVYFVATFPGKINDVAAGRYYWTDRGAKLAIARDGVPEDANWDWGVMLLDPYTGGVIERKSYSGAQPQAVALGDLFSLADKRELFIGVGDHVDVVSSQPTENPAPPSIHFQTGSGGTITSLETGFYDSIQEAVLVVGRRTGEAETDGLDTHWKVAVLKRGMAPQTWDYAYRYAWGFVGNVAQNPLGAIDVNTQPMFLKLGDMNADGINELAVATYTKLPESTELANLVPRTWLLVYSETLPHAEDEPGWGAEDQFVGQTLRTRTVGRPTGLAFADVDGDGVSELAMSILRKDGDSQYGLGYLPNPPLGCAKTASVLNAECPGLGLAELLPATQVVPTPDDARGRYL